MMNNSYNENNQKENINTDAVPSPESADHSAPDTTHSAQISSSTPVNESTPSTVQNDAVMPQHPMQADSYAQHTQHTSQNEHVYSSYNAAAMPQKKTKKTQKSGLSAGAVAILCITCLLLSSASGFFGAYLATQNISPSSSGTVSGTDHSSVVYQSSESPANGMSANGGTSSYYDVANAVKASVVEINTEYQVNSYFQYITSGAGSGVILTKDGYILTNNHVIADTSSQNNTIADSIVVRLINGEEYSAKVIGTDADSDIAVIKIETQTELPCIVAGNSDKLAVGEEVIAVGNPLGELGGTVTNGIISALDREIDVGETKMNLLQTNAAINPGNSGGGLFNMAGELIGIVNAKSSGTGIEGLGFAIPVNDAINIAEQLITNGYVSGKPYLGVSFYDVDNVSKMLYYRLNNLGVYVFGMDEGLNDSVFQIGDRVIAVDDQEIASVSDIKTILKSHSVGDTIKFSVYRGGKLMELYPTCFEKGQNDSSFIDFDK